MMADDQKKPDEFDSDEQRDAHIEALKSELVAVKARGHRRAADVEAELRRFGVGSKSERAANRQARPRGAAAEKREASDG